MENKEKMPDRNPDVIKFLKGLERKSYSKNTLKVYGFILDKYFAHNSKVTVSGVNNFIDEGKKDEKMYATKSKFLLIACFKSFLNSLGKWEMGRKLDFPKKDKLSPLPLTKSQVKVLLATPVQKNEHLQKRNRLLLELFYSTGLRVSEVHDLNKTDIDLEEGFLLVRKGKGKKNRFVRLSKKWMVHYSEFVGKDKSKTPIFLNKNSGRLSVRSMQNIVQEASIKSGVLVGSDKLVSPHTFRSTYTTHNYEAGMNLLAIQAQLGHESLDTTRRYTKLGKGILRKLNTPLDRL